MKVRISALLVFSVAILASCKNDKSVEDLPVVTPEEKEANVEVILNATVKKDDTFQLFYTEDGSLNFDEKLSVRTPVKGSDAPQEIRFVMPDDSALTQLRVDIGENKEQETIKINNFVVKSYGKVWEVKGNTFFTYFLPNEQAQYDFAQSTVTPLKTDVKIHDPFLQPQLPLKAELEKIVK